MINNYDHNIMVLIMAIILAIIYSTPYARNPDRPVGSGPGPSCMLECYKRHAQSKDLR